MIRYVCRNADCLNTFLSLDLERFKKCELCGQILMHVGKPEKIYDKPYPPSGESTQSLKIEYVRLMEKSLTVGLTEEEGRKIGRCVRNISPEERKKFLKKVHLWKEDVIYKHAMTEEGLSKMIPDENAMNYQKRRAKKAMLQQKETLQ